MAKDTREVSTKLDAKLLAALPDGGHVVSVTPAGRSEFCKTYRIVVALPDRDFRVFFQKLSTGQSGLDLMHAVWASETAMNSVIPGFTPRPVGLGTYESNHNVHFFLTEFVDMIEDVVPGPEEYMAAVIALHSRTKDKSPTGKFGFHASTAYGNILQNNTWESSWEVFWTRIMKEAFETEENSRGPHDGRLKSLKNDWFGDVIPRYIRPLESGGRSVKPCLVHADLWPGNVRYKMSKDSVCVYDANAFWGHNEVDLGLFRNPRYPLGKTYLTEYWKHIPISKPEEDAEARNNVYMVRNQVLLSALFPNDPNLREIFVDNMQSIVERLMEVKERPHPN